MFTSEMISETTDAETDGCQVEGWGVWVEAIEIADVRICSAKLFEDLQAAAYVLWTTADVVQVSSWDRKKCPNNREQLGDSFYAAIFFGIWSLLHWLPFRK